MGYDFESDKKYNYEKNISMSFDLDKTCYSKGELITGNIILIPKEGIFQTQLLNPYAIITLEERQSYTFLESYYDYGRNIASYRDKKEEENKTLLSITMNFSNYDGANIISGIHIPFQIKVPETAYPSCFFGKKESVKHFLICDFPSIEAKKTNIIIIKNDIYFSKYNGLLKAPAEYNINTTKYKYGFFDNGELSAKIIIPKNIFCYNENISFVIDIDCSKLTIQIKSIKICIQRRERKNNQKNHAEIREEKKTEIMNKIIDLKKGEPIYHLEDSIKFPVLPAKLNPKEVYTNLDNDKRNHNEKFKDIKLFPTCYGGLLSCEYFIKIIFEMDSWFSTNEQIKIPIDFYEPFNVTDNLTKLDDKDNIIINNNNSKLISQIMPPQSQNIFKPDDNNLFDDLKNEEQDLPTEEEIIFHKNNNINRNDDVKQNEIVDDKDDLNFNLLK